MTITPSAYIEQRDNGRWYVIYGGTVVGQHTAQYKAREQADALNSPDDDGEPDYYARCAARTAKGTQCTRTIAHTGAAYCAQHGE
jgi:hypothetical protein